MQTEEGREKVRNAVAAVICSGKHHIKKVFLAVKARKDFQSSVNVIRKVSL